jgi:hypothetical protein
MEFEQTLEIVRGAFDRTIHRSLTEAEVALLQVAWNHLIYDRIAEQSSDSTTACIRLTRWPLQMLADKLFWRKAFKLLSLSNQGRDQLVVC